MKPNDWQDTIAMAASAIEDLLETADEHAGCWADVPARLRALTAPPAPVVNSQLTGATAVPDFKKLARELVENLVDCGGVDDSSIKQYLKWTEKTCRAAMLEAAPPYQGG